MPFTRVTIELTPAQLEAIDAVANKLPYALLAQPFNTGEKRGTLTVNVLTLEQYAILNLSVKAAHALPAYKKE